MDISTDGPTGYPRLEILKHGEESGMLTEFTICMRDGDGARIDFILNKEEASRISEFLAPSQYEKV